MVMCYLPRGREKENVNSLDFYIIDYRLQKESVYEISCFHPRMGRVIS